jgi:hypothetical protein
MHPMRAARSSWHECVSILQPCSRRKRTFRQSPTRRRNTSRRDDSWHCGAAYCGGVIGLRWLRSSASRSECGEGSWRGCRIRGRERQQRLRARSSALPRDAAQLSENQFSTSRFGIRSKCLTLRVTTDRPRASAAYLRLCQTWAPLSLRLSPTWVAIVGAEERVVAWEGSAEASASSACASTRR